MAGSADAHFDFGFPPALSRVERDDVVREFEDRIVKPEVDPWVEGVDDHIGFVGP